MKLLPMMLLGATLSMTLSPLAFAQGDPQGSLAITNVAAGKPATQHSTFSGGDASRAVDGNTDGHIGHGSVTHTMDVTGAWWEVDLQQATTILRISVFNRTDCCDGRLSNFTVQILDADRAVVKEFITNTVAPSLLHFAAAGSKGRYVRVQLNSSNTALSLAEVQVWAES